MLGRGMSYIHEGRDHCGLACGDVMWPEYEGIQ